MKCKCGHTLGDHIIEDDYSACVGDIPNGALYVTSYTATCDCKRFALKEEPVLVQ
jgi:hypothetical protein